MCDHVNPTIFMFVMLANVCELSLFYFCKFVFTNIINLNTFETGKETSERKRMNLLSGAGMHEYGECCITALLLLVASGRIFTLSY